MINDFVILALLIIVVEAVTEILVDSKIMEGLRSHVFRKANLIVPDDWPADVEYDGPPIRRPWPFVNAILGCGYCASVWVAGVAAFFAPQWFRASAGLWDQDAGWFVATVGFLAGWLGAILIFLLNWAVNAAVLHRLSNWLHVVFMLVKKGRVRTYDLELRLPGLSVNHLMSVEIQNGSPGSGVGAPATTAGPEQGPQAG